MIKVIRSEPNGVQLFPTFQGDTFQWPNKALTGLCPPLKLHFATSGTLGCLALMMSFLFFFKSLCLVFISRT